MSTEYFCPFLHRTLYPDLNESLDEFRVYLSESNKELAALKQWQLQGEEH